MQKNVKSKFKQGITLLLIFFSLSLAHAQNNTTNPYSRYGIGLLNSKGFARNQGMGGVGIGLYSSDYLNNTNPAALSNINYHTVFFDAAFEGKYMKMENSTQSQKNTSANIKYAALGFACTKWWSMSAGLNPFSSVGYTITDGYTSGTDVFTSKYVGTGGVSEFYIDNAFHPFKDFSIGLHTAYLYGPMTQHIEEYMRNDSTYETYTYTNNKRNFSDIYFSYGLQYSHLFKEKYRLTLGLIYANAQSISAKQTSFVTNYQHYPLTGATATDTIADSTLRKGSVRLPQMMGVGISLSSDKFSIAADYKVDKWSEASFFDGKDANLSNSEKFSVGFEYAPSLISKSYFEVMRYRLGFRYEKTYYKFSNVGQLEDMAISWGFGLPMQKNRSLINLAFEVGTMGKRQAHAIRERYASFTLNLSLYDVWFTKRKFD